MPDPPSLAPEAAAHQFTVGVLRPELLSEADIAVVEQELKAYGEHWAVHYSSYNKRKRWTAFALRGYRS